MFSNEKHFTFDFFFVMITNEPRLTYIPVVYVPDSFYNSRAG